MFNCGTKCIGAAALLTFMLVAVIFQSFNDLLAEPIEQSRNRFTVIL
jgi:hypothetical protein